MVEWQIKLKQKNQKQKKQKEWKGKHIPDVEKLKKKLKMEGFKNLEEKQAKQHSNKLRGMNKKKFDSKNYFLKKVHNKKW